MRLFLRIIYGIIGVAAFYWAIMYGFAYLHREDTFNILVHGSCPNIPPFAAKIYFGMVTDAPLGVCSGEKLLNGGWSARESGGVWTIGTQAYLKIATQMWPTGDIKASFDASSYVGLGFYAGVQKVRASIQGEVIGEWVFMSGLQAPDTTFIIPHELRRKNDPVNIVLLIDAPLNPKALGTSGDDRELGLHLRTATFNAWAIGDACPRAPPLGAHVYFGTVPDSAVAYCSGERLLALGWGTREAGGVWTLGIGARLTVPTKGWPDGDVKAMFSASSYVGLGFHEGVQTIHAFIDGEKVAQWVFTTGKTPDEISLIIPSKARANGRTVDIDLEIDPPANPKVLGKGMDDRDLGLSLRSVVFLI
jgi:hypothetical protein